MHEEKLSLPGLLAYLQPNFGSQVAWTRVSSKSITSVGGQGASGGMLGMACQSGRSFSRDGLMKGEKTES